MNIPAFDCHDVLESSLKALILWQESNVSPICASNIFSSPAAKLLVQFENIEKQVVHYKYPESIPAPSSATENNENNYNPSKRKLEEIQQMTTFGELSNEQLALVWKFGRFLKDDPKSLPLYLLSVNYSNYQTKLEAYYWMNQWAELEPAQALELISGKFMDPNVRRFGVTKLGSLSDSQILDFLPQLCQALRYEKEHHSPLAMFLVNRALKNRHRIGHYFYWMLKSEIHLPQVAERYFLFFIFHFSFFIFILLFLFFISYFYFY